MLKYLVAILIVSVTPHSADAAQLRPRRPGVLLLKPKQNTSNQVRGFIPQSIENNLLERRGYKLHKNILGVQVFRKSAGADSKLFSATGISATQSEEELAKELMATGNYEFAEPDYLVKPAFIPNDRHFRSQWHHTAIHSQDAWNISMGDARVRVLVCDSGVDASHPDLRGHIQLPGINTVDGSRNTSAVNLHGTAVAGTIGAIADNSTGVAGVAGKVTIVPGRVSNSSDGSAYLSDMAECIRWGADNRIPVVNLSYSGAESATIDQAAQYLRARGGLLVMAAGNENRNISSFPDYSSFLLVGAVGENLQRASFSNYGTPVDIVAPGVNILTTVPNAKYTYMNGTSFAAPVVAGAAALVLSINRSLSPAAVEKILLSTASDVGRSGEDSVYGRGLLNIGKAAALAVRTLR